jgi:hypothetical protein
LLKYVKKIKQLVRAVIQKKRELYIVSDLRAARIGSFPFISGDTFRGLADYVIDKESDIKRFPIAAIVGRVNELGKVSLVIFVALSAVESDSSQSVFLDWLTSLSKSFKDIRKSVHLKIIFHNGDKTPSVDFYKNVKFYSDEVFSVNVTDDISGVIPVPIGLENLHYLKNGLLMEFMNQRISGVFENKECVRSRHILSSFSVHTNPIQREPLLHAIEKSRHPFCGVGMSSSTFRQAVLDSMFVISPPGNGLDCHRTWEAIALGAVPVVKSGMLAKSLVNALPIHEVDDWDDFLSLPDLELENLFHRYKNMQIDRALMPYWCNRILY